MSERRSEPVPAPMASMLLEPFVASRHALVDAAARIVGCRCMAEDVVQDTWIKLAGQGAGTTIDKPVAYLFRTVRNLAIDRYRSRALEQRYLCGEEEGMLVGCPFGTPEQRMLQRESLCTVVDALAQLPERTRRAFELCRVEGRSQKDIATMLGVSPTLVNFMIRDAALHCRTALVG